MGKGIDGHAGGKVQALAALVSAGIATHLRANFQFR